MHLLKKYRLLSLLMMVFAGCSVGKHYQRAEGIADPKLYRSVQAADSISLAETSWEDIFSDTLLKSLIRQALANNNDLQVAAARVRAAAANYRQSRLSTLPTVDLNGVASYQRVPATQFGFPEAYQLSINAGWEIDIWGKLNSTKRAFLASFLKSEAFQRTVQTQLIADLVTNYYRLLAYDSQLSITERTVSNRISEVETMRSLKESGVVTGAAVVQSTANRYSVEITIPDLKQNIRETENAISVLLGNRPDTIYRGRIDEQEVIPILKTGVPAGLLANRPDVQQAELQLRSSAELVNVARTYFYPTITITGSAGLSGTSIKQFLDPASFFANITGGLLQPIFNRGLNKQRLAVAAANRDEDLASFKKSLLIAGQEVSNALYAYDAAVTKQGLRANEISFLEKSVDYTKELLKYSSATNYTDVLTSEQNLLSAQLNSINDRLQQLIAGIDLYRSLGGGAR